MAGGAILTEAEVTCIAESVARRETSQQTHHRYTAEFPEAGRKITATTALRSNPKVLAKIQHIVDAGMAALHPVMAAGKRHVAHVEHDTKTTTAVRTTWDPDSRELTILKPKNADWTKPADLLTRAGIAFEFDDLGHPVPIRYTMPPIDLNEWGTAMKVGPEKRPVVVPNWQCSLKLKPRNDAPVLKAMEDILERIGEAREADPVHAAEPQGDHMLELLLPDLHFGKLGHRDETGEDMDSKIIMRRMREAAESIISRAARAYPLSRSLFVVGNDLLNIDSARNETTAGTRQDSDSRYYRVLDQAMEGMTFVIDRLAQEGPVDVEFAGGNHDGQTIIAVARFLQAYYRHSDGITINTSPAPRKYYTFGDVLLGFTHGDKEPVRSLPLIMADEAPGWSSSRFREWHIGHLHKSKEMEFLATDESRGVRVRHLPSLTGLDAWHAEKGYRSQKQADGFVWHGELGLRDIVIEQR